MTTSTPPHVASLEPRPARSRLVGFLLGSLFILLFLISGWLYYQMTIFRAEVVAEVARTRAALVALEEQTDRQLRAAQSDIGALERELRSVRSIALNADNYAHSHSRYSDERLKRAITPLSRELEHVLALEPVRYRWNRAGNAELHLADELEIGLVAQQVESLYPEVVGSHDGYLTVEYESLVPVLIRAIQEQQQQIEALEERIDATAGQR